jgi:hypothetical protein
LHKVFPNEYPAKLQKILGSTYTVCNWGRYRSAVTTTVMGGIASPYVNTQEYQCSLGKCPADFAYKGQCNTETPPAEPPSYVFLGPWGKADTMESRVPLRQEQVEKDLRALAESYLALPNRPKVFIVYPFPVPYPRDGTPAGPVTDVMLPAFKNVASAMKLPVIDLYSYFSTHLDELERTHDGHLTEAVGHFRHAEMVAAAIRSAGPPKKDGPGPDQEAPGGVAGNTAPGEPGKPAPPAKRGACAGCSAGGALGGSDGLGALALALAGIVALAARARRWTRRARDRSRVKTQVSRLLA